MGNTWLWGPWRAGGVTVESCWSPSLGPPQWLQSSWVRETALSLLPGGTCRDLAPACRSLTSPSTFRDPSAFH